MTIVVASRITASLGSGSSLGCGSCPIVVKGRNSTNKQPTPIAPAINVRQARSNSRGNIPPPSLKFLEILRKVSKQRSEEAHVNCHSRVSRLSFLSLWNKGSVTLRLEQGERGDYVSH